MTDISYSSTINLPQTGFPMKAGLAQKEPLILQEWEEKGLYARMRKHNQGRPQFMLHDGPPYANGHIHMGHALNKVLKDIIIKYKTMAGYDCPYVPGWDCHGLPVELQVFKQMGATKHDVDHGEFRKKAAVYAWKFIDIQREEFKRLGVFGAWDNPYVTMSPEYEASIVESFCSLYFDGYIERRKKPIHWCASCETALAEAEVEYEDHRSPSIYVKFPVKSFSKSVPASVRKISGVSAIIWTTTPWTLPANLAVAVGADYTYAVVSVCSEMYLLAKNMLPAFHEQVLEPIGIDTVKILAECQGGDLLGTQLEHPFMDRIVPLISSSHVTLETGTGLVHIAPGHGHDDYLAGLKHGLDVICPVDRKGVMTEEAGPFAGNHIYKANPKIIERLSQDGNLVFKTEVTHSYPHCWRCKKPILFRAESQWFVDLDANGLRQKALEEITKVRWIPGIGQKRIASMVEKRPDWCLSRQRLWGVPITVFYCGKCGKPVLTEEMAGHFLAIIKKQGLEAWFTQDPADLVPKGTACPGCGGRSFEKETDILDVWFDSGVSHKAVIVDPERGKIPVDLYLEGSDQHRGWFQSALLTAAALYGKAPYKAVLTHGFVVDGEGKKMSKSAGNVMAPQEIIKQYGADILRLWVASVDFSTDVRLSNEIVRQLVDVYRRIRNTIRFCLGNLTGYDPDKVPAYGNLLEIDRWMLSRLQGVIAQVSKAYDSYEFYRVFHILNMFCTVDLSSFYLDILKDRLYIYAQDSRERLSAQYVLEKILKALLAMAAPIIPFTVHESWAFLPEEILSEGEERENIHLSSFPKVDAALIDKQLDEKWGRLADLKSMVAKVLEEARSGRAIGSSLEAQVVFTAQNAEMEMFLRDNKEVLKTVLIVSDAGLEAAAPKKGVIASGQEKDICVFVLKARGDKCLRCWNYTSDSGKSDIYPGTCARCSGILAAMSAPAMQRE